MFSAGCDFMPLARQCGHQDFVINFYVMDGLMVQALNRLFRGRHSLQYSEYGIMSGPELIKYPGFFSRPSFRVQDKRPITTDVPPEFKRKTCSKSYSKSVSHEKALEFVLSWAWSRHTYLTEEERPAWVNVEELATHPMMMEILGAPICEGYYGKR